MENINLLHNKITLDLANYLKQNKLTEDEVISYMILFESLKDDLEKTKQFILKINEKKWLFDDIVNQINYETQLENEKKNLSFSKTI